MLPVCRGSYSSKAQNSNDSKDPQKSLPRKPVLHFFASFFGPLRFCASYFHSQEGLWIAFSEVQSVQFGSPRTLTQPTMTSMLMRAFQNQSANLKRGIGLLLLIFIVYGTTVEAAHRHGRVGPRSNAAASFEQTGSKSTTPTTQPGC